MTPRRDLEKILAGKDKSSKPGMPGFVQRARVPQPSKKDYVIRPKWNVEEKPLRVRGNLLEAHCCCCVGRLFAREAIEIHWILIGNTM